MVTAERVHEGVEFLLSYLPPSLRLVIAGRADPPLPLPRLRAQGELTEVRMTDLSFSEPEAGELVASVAAVDLDRHALASLVGRTEGWAAGLQLAALTIKGRTAPSAAVEAIRGDNRHILDFFTSEVIGRLDQDQRDLLVRTSGAGEAVGAAVRRGPEPCGFREKFWRSSMRRTSLWFRWMTAASGTAVIGCSVTPSAISSNLRPQRGAGPGCGLVLRTRLPR